jgi:tRNA (guanine-N7-)-methyltransferase
VITAPPIRTYHPRQGRLSARHRAALIGLGTRLGLPAHDDLAEAFGRVAPVVVEIGSGMGEATAAMAAADPDRDYLAVEVHRPGVANLLSLVDAGRLANVRVVEGDALDLLRHRIAPGRLGAVHAFFPDPWPKARHHKRRLVTPANVALLRSRLAVGGTLWFATDSAPYAEQMCRTLAADGQLSTVDASAPRRPVTKFEQRARDAGRAIHDVLVRRRPAP